MDWSQALGNALRSWGQQKTGGAVAQGNPAPGAAARATFGQNPGTTAGALNSDNRAAYGQYVDGELTKGNKPLTYADWLQMQTPASQSGDASYVGGVQVPAPPNQ